MNIFIECDLIFERNYLKNKMQNIGKKVFKTDEKINLENKSLLRFTAVFTFFLFFHRRDSSLSLNW
jgi:hypothetical protein